MATTADRVLAVLALFSGNKWTWTVEEAACELGIPTSTTYRYFKSLADAELVSSQVTGSYVLGPAVCGLDRAMRMHDPLINAARPVMREMVEKNENTIILLARLYKNKVMCVHREGTSLKATGYERGRPMPLDRGAASKVILANLPARQLRSLAKENAVDGTSEIEDLRDELKRIRSQGYSITYGEIDPTKVGVSVPVFRSKEVLEGSLSFVLEADAGDSTKEMVERLIRSCKAIEANLMVEDYVSPDVGK